MRNSKSRRKHATPQALGALLEGIYPSKEPEDAFAIRAFAWWRRTVPPRVYRNALPVRIARGVLTVHTKTATWASELQFLSASLLKSLQAQVPHLKVTDIRFRVGPMPEVSPVGPPHGNQPDPRAEHDAPEHAPALLTEVPEVLGQALARISSDELRQMILRSALQAEMPASVEAKVSDVTRGPRAGRPKAG
jgi:hypothetical protein